MNRCLKKMNEAQKSGAGAGKTPTCKLFQQLLFIKDTLQNREATSSNISLFNSQEAIASDLCTTYSQDAGATASNLFIPHNQEFQPLSPPSTPTIFTDRSKKTSTPTPPPTAKSLKRKSSTSSDIDMLLAKALSESSQRQETTKESSDWLFCKNLVEILEKLPPKKNRLARLDIQKTLLSYEFDED